MCSNVSLPHAHLLVLFLFLHIFISLRTSQAHTVPSIAVVTFDEVLLMCDWTTSLSYFHTCMHYVLFATTIHTARTTHIRFLNAVVSGYARVYNFQYIIVYFMVSCDWSFMDEVIDFTRRRFCSNKHICIILIYYWQWF